MGFIYIEHIAAFVVENYSESLEKLEDDQLVIRVIFQELKCLCHVRNDFHAFHADYLPTLTTETRGRISSIDWMKQRECLRCFRSRKRGSGINSHWCIWHLSSCPNQSRCLQMNTRRSSREKALLIGREHPYPLFGQKPACILCPARVEQCTCSNSCVRFLVFASLPDIARSCACDNRFVWGDVYLIVIGKLEVWTHVKKSASFPNFSFLNSDREGR